MPIYKTNRKKDGVQAYRVYVSFMLNGERVQRTKTVYGRDAAKQAEHELMLDATATYDNVKTDDFIDIYCSQKECRDSTRERTKRQLDRYVRGKFGKLTKISINDVAEWKADIAKLPLGQRTKQNIFRDFSAMLNFAYKRKIIPENPCRFVEKFKSEPKPHTAITYYTAEEWLKYASVARQDAEETGDFRYYVFFSIAFYTGMRKGEINALKWSDIHGRTISVTRSVCQKVKGKQIVETAPKTPTSIRDLQMPAKLVEILAEHKARQMKDPRFTEDRRVVGDTDILCDTTIENRNKEYAAAAGLKHIRIHDFRHSHASLLVNAGINIQEVARRLGHADVQETWRTYSHLYPQEEERAVKVFDSISV